MSDLEAQFKTAAGEVQNLSRRPDNATLLKLYALYKQSTQGNVSGPRPPLKEYKDRAKYDSWARLRGHSQEKAMKDYVALVDKLKKSHGY